MGVLRHLIGQEKDLDLSPEVLLKQRKKEKLNTIYSM